MWKRVKSLFKKDKKKQSNQKETAVVPSQFTISNPIEVNTLVNGVNALHMAIQYGRLEAVQFLVAQGAELTLPTAAGDTSLCLAIRHNQVNIAKYLIHQGVACPLATLWQEAFGAPSFESMVFLVQQGLDLELKNADGDTVLGVVLTQIKNEQDADTQEAWIAVAIELIAHNADFYIKNDAGQSAFERILQLEVPELIEALQQSERTVNPRFLWFWAARTGHLEILQSALTQLELNSVQSVGTTDKAVDLIDEKGFRAIHLAVKNGHTTVVAFLIAQEANLEAKTRKGNTALEFAVVKGHTEIVELLLAAHLSANVCTVKQVPLLLVAYQKRFFKIMDLLIMRDAAVNLRNAQGVPLIYSVLNNLNIAFKKSVEQQATEPDVMQTQWAHLAKALISKGANLGVVGKGGKTAISQLLDPYHSALVTVALEAGKQSLVHHWFLAAFQGDTKALAKVLATYPEAKTATAECIAPVYQGWTALHFAVRQQKVEAVKFLLTHKANVFAKTGKGESVLQIAVINNQVAIAALLITAKVSVNADLHKGHSLLWVAYKHQYFKMMALLIDNEADLKQPNSEGISFISAILSQLASADTLQRGQWLQIAKIVLQKGVELMAESSGQASPMTQILSLNARELFTVIMDAPQHYSEQVRWLLAAGLGKGAVLEAYSAAPVVLSEPPRIQIIERPLLKKEQKNDRGYHSVPGASL